MTVSKTPPGLVTDATRVCAPRHVFAREFDGELVLLDLARGEYYALDAIGARLWHGLIAGSSPAEVAEQLEPDYDVAVETLRADLVALTGELVARGLAEPLGGREGR